VHDGAGKQEMKKYLKRYDDTISPRSEGEGTRQHGVSSRFGTVVRRGYHNVTVRAGCRALRHQIYLWVNGTPEDKDAWPSHDLQSVTALDSLNAGQRHMIPRSAFQPREDAKHAFGNRLQANRDVRRLTGPPVRTRGRRRVPNGRNDFPRAPERWV